VGEDEQLAIHVSPVTPAIGALVEGIDLSRELEQRDIDRIGELLVQHQVLFFRNQPLTPHEQVRFAARFGTLHVHPIYPVLPEIPEILVLDTSKEFLPDNDNWHTDVTFSETPPLAGILSAKQIPRAGGDTLWSSCSAAYEALSEPMRRMLDGLTAQHSVAKSFPAERWQNDPAFKEKYERAIAKHPPVNHPVVRTHPVTGRKGLFVNGGFTTHINELRPTESRVLLDFLDAHASRPEFTVRWHWKVDDVVFWDNRVTQHYAVADYLPERRVVYRATVNGDKPY
jgi:taurine dioxygenase